MTQISTWYIYCDESRQNTNKYKLLGGIWVLKEHRELFLNEFYSLCLRKRGQLPAHMKWTSTPPVEDRHMVFYTDLIDLYFEYNRKHFMYFKTIVAPPEYKMDHPIYHSGDFEEGFYKLYYDLVIHTLRYQDRYHLRIAQRSPSKKKANLTENDRLQILKEVLNKKIQRKVYWRSVQDVVLSAEARAAGNCLLIQLADIFMGAIGYQLNGFHRLPDAKKGKQYLSHYICRKLGKKDLCFRTAWDDKTFNIFFLEL